MRLLLQSLLCLVVTHSMAFGFEVRDPQNEFSHMLTWMQPVDFKSAFQCGTEFSFTSEDASCTEKCTNSYCQSTCTNQSPNTIIKLYVENCTDTSVSIYGDNGWSMEVSREDYEKGSNTLAIPILKNIGHFLQPEGDITIGMSGPFAQYIYINNGDKTYLQTYSLRADIETNTAQKPSLEIILDRNASGLRQIIEIKHEDANFLKLKGAFNAY